MSNFDLPPLGFDPRRVQDPEGAGRIAGPEAGAAPPSDFGGVLAQSLDQLGALQDEVTQKTRGLVLGRDVELHDLMLATSKSEVAFNLMLEVRNKLVDAWEKLSRSAV